MAKLGDKAQSEAMGSEGDQAPWEWKTGLTLSASSGVPNILALIFFRCFLTATFMAEQKPRDPVGCQQLPTERRRKGRDKAVGILRVGLDSSTCACCFPFWGASALLTPLPPKQVFCHPSWECP